MHNGREIRVRRAVAGAVVVAGLIALVTVHDAQASVDRASTVVAHAHVASSQTQPGRYRDHVFTKVDVVRGIVYRQVAGIDGRQATLTLDVYQPAADTVRDRPVFVWFHSGGFTQDNAAERARFATDFAQRGYVAITAEYRLRPKMQWFDMQQRPHAARDAYDDATGAIDWVRAHAADYGIDANEIFSGGYSAGAVTAFDLVSPPDGSQSRVAASMAIAGYGNGTPHAGAPPILAFAGTTDLLVPPHLTSESCNAALNAGARCELDTIDGGHEIGNTNFAEITDKAAAFFADVLTDR
jgi:predicted esterase